MPARLVPEKFLVAFSLAGEQRELVQAIAQAVEEQLGRGTVFLDEWFEHYIAGDDADLKLQEIYGRKCELAVVCVSQRYGAKPWTQAEHRAIRARFQQCGEASEKRQRDAILPIRVGDGEVEGIFCNTIVPDVRQRSAAQSAELIIERLRLLRPDLATGVAKAPSAGPAWPTTAPPLSWPMADHSRARATFAELLTAGVAWRLLRLCGVSETGKSHITRQMLANVLAISDIACGRFDFKGTTDMARETRAFVFDLGVAAPATTSRLHEGLDQILVALRQRAQPTLLIFDTYEMAGETQEWIEKTLLPSLIRATWLRVVIAGQCVPHASGAVWATVACPTVHLELPQAADWYDYGRLHRADLRLEDVETVCHLARGKASLLAQLLGPAA